MTDRSLTARLRHMAPELSKFVLVGGLCFVLDTVLANVFRFKLGLGPTTSKGLSSVIATIASYLGNRLWSFSHRVDTENPTHGRDILLFGGINALGLVITLIPVDIMHYVLQRDSTLAFNVASVIGTAIATVFRFFAYRRWVFASPSAPSGADGSVAAVASRTGDRPDGEALDRAV